jgi:small GTP-binding protein
MDIKTTLSEEDEKLVIEKILHELTSKPPTIGVIGVSGTGKSSTINALFRTNLDISHVAACTKEFKEIDLKVEINQGQAQGKSAILRFVDAPGLGEHIDLDDDYLKMYADNLPKCDIILWVLTARNRAIALDQMYLKRLSEYSEKIVFGINQVDLVNPIDWDTKINLPSKEQERNIDLIVKDRKDKIESILKREIKIIPYSADKRYNLQELFTEIIESCPKNRAWIFSAVKGFKPEDFLPEDARDKILEILKSRNKK